ncbi:MAG: ATP synthase F1 subunit delta [Bacteroidota bacterium]|nr:ATP synthase F1 subunit delta [Bacteroidota bacterium]MDP4229405.1 ATP synthase F1 subunit delta [Bacteroidota bacterium]
MDQRIALRYAQALMDIGKEKNSVAEIARDMKVVHDALHDVHELKALLHTPVIRPDTKRKVLHSVFGPHIGKDTMLFMDLLVKKGRADVLDLTTSEFLRLLDTDTNTVSALITSARTLDEGAKQEIVQKLEKLSSKSVRASYEVDPTLRGGFVAKVGDTLIDASLQHQLENLREEFKRGMIARVN